MCLGLQDSVLISFSVLVFLCHFRPFALKPPDHVCFLFIRRAVVWKSVNRSQCGAKSCLPIHSSFISIQPQRPGWQEPKPSHVTGMALAHCILGKLLGVVCHCFPPPLDVPTFAARCLYICNDARDTSSERWNCGREICPVILPKFRLPRKFGDLLHAVNLRHGTDGFTSPPKEGVLRIFSHQANVRQEIQKGRLHLVHKNVSRM